MKGAVAPPTFNLAPKLYSSPNTNLIASCHDHVHAVMHIIVANTNNIQLVTLLMAGKRVRQATLFENLMVSGCSKKRVLEDHGEQHLPLDLVQQQSQSITEDVHSNDVNSDSTIEDTANDGQLCDDIHHDNTEDECSAVCCINDKPFQPVDKNILLAMSKSGRKFVPRWFIYHSWLTVCITRKFSATM